MPDDAIDIYIDLSFLSVDPGTDDVYTSLRVNPADNIGLRDTVGDYKLIPRTSGVLGYTVEVYTSYSGEFQDGYVSTLTRYRTNTTMSGMAVALIDYAIPTSVSGLSRTEDADLAYFTGLTKVSGILDADVQFIGGQLYAFSDNIFSYFHSEADEVAEDDYEANYTAGGEYSDLVPGPPEDQVIISGTNDYDGYFTVGSATNSGTIQEECELFLAGYPLEFHPSKYTYRFHLAAGMEADKQGAEWEAVVISGSVIDIPIDVTSTATTSGYYNYDAVCGKTSFSGVDFPVALISYSFTGEVISGTIGYFDSQAICGVSGTGGYTFDVDLLSLKISNFSLDIDEYASASGTICVDITDDVYNVITSGSYFIIGETITSGTSFIPITDGYTMCYDSPTDFDNILGATTFTVHATNDNGDILERDFYVTSGYIVEYDNRIQDYGLGNQVVVRATAENLASCPDTGVDAYFFTTAPKFGIDLPATIVGMAYNRVVVTPSGVELAAVVGTQQYSAEFYDFENNIVPGISPVWSTNGGGTIDSNGLFTAGSKIGTFENSVVASLGDLEGYASVEVKDIDTVYFYGKTFRIEIRAKDFAGNVMEPFTFEFKIEDKPE